ncbi:girdin-like [Diprion similis]|uniref:girdin-like n=1 Tax=Diprion similis TaxID=362088 RepID=UPI001EF82E9C|nr:girdin-like [Diprion similis]
MCASRDTLDISEMQSVDLSAEFTENTASSGVDCQFSGTPVPDFPYEATRESQLFDEVVELRQQVADLNQTIAHVEAAVQLKDTQLEGLQRDNERLSSELKKQQRCNRNLKLSFYKQNESTLIPEQLDDERFFYQKEKEHFCEEMQNHKTCKRMDAGSTRSLQQQKKEFERIQEALEEENKQMREELVEKSETTYNLCIKFLRMKHAKDSLRQKLDQLLREHLQVMAEMMEKLDEAREELNIIVSEKFQEPVHLSKAKFLQVVQRNSRLVHENAALKLQSHQLTQNIEKLKSEAQKTRTINVDARTIEKLTMQGKRRRKEETAKSLSTKKAEKLGTSRSSLSTSYGGPLVDSSGDAKAQVKYQNKRATFDIPEVEEPPEKRVEHRTERTHSAPEIVQTATFKQNLASGNGSEYTNLTQRSVEVRDMYTNT